MLVGVSMIVNLNGEPRRFDFLGWGLTASKDNFFQLLRCFCCYCLESGFDIQQSWHCNQVRGSQVHATRLSWQDQRESSKYLEKTQRSKRNKNPRYYTKKRPKLEVRPGTETETTEELDLVALRVLHGEVLVTQGHKGTWVTGWWDCLTRSCVWHRTDGGVWSVCQYVSFSCIKSFFVQNHTDSWLISVLGVMKKITIVTLLMFDTSLRTRRSRFGLKKKGKLDKFTPCVFLNNSFNSPHDHAWPAYTAWCEVMPTICCICLVDPSKAFLWHHSYVGSE